MKKLIVGIAVIFLLVSVLPTLSSCGVGDTVKDDFGFKRPKDSWITECLLLPKEPVSDEEIAELGDIYTANQDNFIKYEELWGESGENGLASKAAVAMDGQTNEKGQCWLVYLIYANAGIPQYNGDYRSGCASVSQRITLFNEDAKTVNKIQRGAKDYGDITNYFSGENWVVECLEDAGGDYGESYEPTPVQGALQGALAFPIEVPWGDVDSVPLVSLNKCALYAEISVRGSGAANERIDDFDMCRFNFGEPEMLVEVTEISMRYLPWNVYQSGTYGDEDLQNEPSFENGACCYAVLDLTLTAKQDNDGTHKVTLHTHAEGVSLSVEEASTVEFEQLSVNGTEWLSARYRAPATAGESRTVRTVVRILPFLGGKNTFDVFAVGDSNTKISGKGYTTTAINTGEATFSFELSEDKKSYVITELLKKDASVVVIPDVLWEGLPVTELNFATFRSNKTITHVVIGKNCYLPSRAFAGCSSLRTVSFHGTKLEWEALDKDRTWHWDSVITQIICSDGTVDLK